MFVTICLITWELSSSLFAIFCQSSGKIPGLPGATFRRKQFRLYQGHLIILSLALEWQLPNSAAVSAVHDYTMYLVVLHFSSLLCSNDPSEFSTQGLGI